jgi:hypothetical protein
VSAALSATGWAPALAASTHNEHWAAADEHSVHVWSGDRLAHSVDLPGLLGGGPPRFLADGTLLAGRYAIAPDTAAATERVPLTLLAEAYDPMADSARLAVTAAWTTDGTHGLVFAQYPPTRLRGDRDAVRPGGMLASVTVQRGMTESVDVRVLDRGRRLDVGCLSADRWLCAGGDELRVFDPARGDTVTSMAFEADVTAVTTVGDVVVAGLSTGDVLTNRVPAGQLLRSSHHEAVVAALALSADGTLAASGDRAGRLVVWRVDGTEAMLHTTVPGSVDGICFLRPDHLVVAVGGPDQTLQHVQLTGDAANGGS